MTGKSTEEYWNSSYNNSFNFDDDSELPRGEIGEMSTPNLTNNHNIIQPQSIVINQVTLSHTIMTNVNATNSIPIATAITPTTIDQNGEIKIVETMPIAGTNTVGLPTVPMQNTSPVKNIQSNINTQETISPILTKQRLHDLIRETDSNLLCEDEVEDYLIAYGEDLVDRMLNSAVNIAKHRHINTVEVKDIQHYLNRSYGIWGPGFGTDELRPYKRSLIAESHKQRLALIRKALKKY